jgi:RHS repeat-associated protein
MRTAHLLTAVVLVFAAVSAGAQHTPAPQSGSYSWDTGAYQYDASGNITAIGTWTFAYDPLNRLAKSHVTASDQTFTYDSFGNMIQQPATDTGTNHMASTIATYDDAGEVTQFKPSDPNHVYGFAYDALGSMTTESLNGASTSYFVYTADDERLRMESTTGPTHWRVRGLDQRVLRDFQFYGMTWSVSRDYVYRGALLAAITPTTVENFSLDHLGSPRLISDVAGNEIARHTYLPFGTELGVNTDGEPMKFTGHERDDDPAGGGGQLDYMHARYYAPIVTRFMSFDPTWESAEDANPQSWNRYAYVMNNPMNFSDPTGKCADVMTCVGLNWAGGQAAASTAAATSEAAAGGAAATSGTTIAASGGTVVLVAGAGIAGYGIGRLIGHIPLGHGRTIDTAVQAGFGTMISLTEKVRHLGDRAKEGSVSDAADQLKSLEERQRRIRQGTATGIIDSTGKSEQRLKDALKHIKNARDADEDDDDDEDNGHEDRQTTPSETDKKPPTPQA